MNENDFWNGFLGGYIEAMTIRCVIGLAQFLAVAFVFWVLW